MRNLAWTSAFGAGTTGGAAAAGSHVYTVGTRRELVAALNDGVYPGTAGTVSNTPKIIYVDGTIDANVDDDNQPLTCADYQRDGFTIEAFLAAYAPATQKATLRGAWLDIRRHSTAGGNPTNIIVRNLTFEDTYDCFPVWSPTDGAQGNWNAAYDSLSLRDADHVWIDHHTFADVATADDTLPICRVHVYNNLYRIRSAEDHQARQVLPLVLGHSGPFPW